ncbi:MAG: hypothetical protein PUC61_00795 [Bacteroidales bacterium]|nr:hypothetical protein [Bacteroidales bacterium]
MKKADQELILETLETFVMTQNLTIDVPEGKIAVVTMKDTDDTLAVLPMTASIMVPCSFNSVQTKALGDSSYTVKYITPKSEKFQSDKFIYDTYFTLAFEDSRIGDYDYNDLVLNFCLDNRATTSKSIYTTDDFHGRLIVNPIALGSTKIIGFGIRIGENGEDILLTDNVRRDYFDGREGFINTGKWQKDILKFDNKVIYQQDKWLGDLYFFIEVDGLRFYAVNAINQDKMLDEKRCPYGIVISNVTGNDQNVCSKMTDQEKKSIKDHPSNSSDVIMKCRTWWRYPLENVTLDDAYYIKCNKQYAGWFDFVLKKKESMSNVCYFDRADEDMIFPSIVFKEDGSLDTDKTVYYNKFL